MSRISLVNDLQVDAGFSKRSAIRVLEMYDNGLLSDAEHKVIDRAINFTRLPEQLTAAMWGDKYAQPVLNPLNYRISNGD